MTHTLYTEQISISLFYTLLFLQHISGNCRRNTYTTPANYIWGSNDRNYSFSSVDTYTFSSQEQTQKNNFSPLLKEGRMMKKALSGQVNTNITI